MSFSLSKKNQNLHQYSLLSNLEGMLLKLHSINKDIIDTKYVRCLFVFHVDHVEQLKAHGDVINDSNNALVRFCETFEEILREGNRSKCLNIYQQI